MRSNIFRIMILSVVALPLATTALLGQNCKSYPLPDGIDPDGIANNQFAATATASVSFDDVDAVKDARDEALMEAKAALAKFLGEEIQSDQTIAKVVNESKTMSGAGKENVRNEAIRRTKLLRNHSQALLKGVTQIGDCYTKGTEVRVTVGVKPEYVAAAEGLASGMGSSSSADSAKSKSNANTGTRQPLAGVDEVSNTQNLRKF